MNRSDANHRWSGPLPEGRPTADGETQWLRRLVPYVKKRWVLVGAAIGISMLYAALLSVMPLLQKVIVDEGIESGAAPILPLLLAMIAAGVACFLLSSAWRYLAAQASYRIQGDMRVAVYASLQRLDSAGHSQVRSGDLFSRAGPDLRWVQIAISWIPEMISTVVAAIVSVCIMATLSPVLAGVVVAIVVAVFAVTYRLRRQVHAAGWDAQQCDAEMTAEIEETVEGVRVIRAFGKQAEETQRVHRAMIRMFHSRVRAIGFRAPLAASMIAGPQFGQVVVLLVGGLFVINEDVTIGVFLAFSGYLAVLAGNIKATGAILSNLPLCRAAIERVGDILDLRSEVEETAIPSVPGRHASAIEFRNVHFEYKSRVGTPVLNGFNLKVEKGETVAVVGPSGGGKTTALQLIPRFFDVTDGSVLVGGIDVKEQSIEGLRSRIGTVLEGSFLFSESIANNIAYGMPSATRDQIQLAAQAACAEEFILETPDGYETVVGERGFTLSGGQRQRLSLARALLTNPDIILLDDATSSLDVETEQDIFESLKGFLESRTAVVIAYRESTVLMADRVVLVDDGLVVDEGSHAELLERSTLYSQLFSPSPIPGMEVSGVLDDARDGKFSRTPEVWHREETDAAGVLAETAASRQVSQRIAELPSYGDRHDVDLAAESADSSPFRLLVFLAPYWKGILIGLSLVIVQIIISLVSPLVVQEAVNVGMLKESESALFVACVVAACLAALLYLDQLSAQRWIQRTTERLLLALRARTYGQLQRLGVDFYDRSAVGRIMTRMTSDIESIAELLQAGLINMMTAVLTFAGMSVVVVLLDPRLALVILGVIPLAGIATWWYRIKARPAYDQAMEQTSILNANVQESLAGIQVTHAFRRESYNLTRFAEISGRFVHSSLRGSFATALYVGVYEFLAVATTAGVLGVGFMLIDSSALSVGTLLAFLLYLGQAFAPLRQIATVFDVYYRAGSGLARIETLLNLKSSTPEVDANPSTRKISGEIEFVDVSLRYEGAAQHAVADINLRILKGQRVAFVGQTGAGKSTIAKLVCRFYDPTSGQILVDGIHLGQLDLAEYRQQLGYVPQEPFLFARSFRDNIAYAGSRISDSEVEAVSRAVGLHDFVATFPNGYHQLLSSRGHTLSAGQRQLICLARALIADPSILILDEATSNLDLASERRVNKAMEAAAHGRTTLVITHRPQSLRWVERVIVVSEAKIVGDHTLAEYEALPSVRRLRLA